ncbi:MAG: hypothetical protein AB1725_05690 [Armatimonadota bacterium]
MSRIWMSTWSRNVRKVASVIGTFDDGLDLKPDASGTLKPGGISAGDSFEFTYLTAG